MIKPINNNQAILIFLTSSVLACLGAAMLAGSVFNLSSFPLSRQILIIALLWLLLASILYLAISRLSDRFGKIRALYTEHLTPGVLFRRIFLAGFLIFPMSMILYVQSQELVQILFDQKLSNFTGFTSTNPPPGFLLAGSLILSTLLIFFIFSAGKRVFIRQFLNELPDFYYILLIFLAAFAARIVFIHFIETQPRSDFALIEKDAALLAQGAQPTDMYVSTHVAITMIYGFLYRAFGRELIVIKVFHLVVYALSGMFLYLAGKRVFYNKLWAGLSGILLTVWPSLALYSNVLTPEHLFILMECALLFAVSLFFDDQEAAHAKKPVGIKKFFIFPIIGFLLGLLGMFRPFSELFLVAFIITLFLWNSGRKFVIWNILGIFTVFIVFWVLGQIPRAVAKLYNNQFPNIRPCSLLVGLNVDSTGLWSMEDYYLCREIRLQAADQDEIAQRVLKIVVERLQARQNQLLPFMNKKFAFLWQNSSGILLWTIQPEPAENSVSTIDMVQKVNVIDFALMFIGTLACLAGTVIAFFKDVKPVIFFGLVTFLGFNLMEIVFEVQTRYRTVVMPLFILFACWTFSTFSTSINIDPLLAKVESGSELTGN